MLVLSRKKNESIMIGDDIELEVISIEGDQVKIGIKAPKSIEVYRKEIFLAIQQENKEAMTANPNLLSHVEKLFNKNK